jgi:hypothetical protein
LPWWFEPWPLWLVSLPTYCFDGGLSWSWQDPLPLNELFTFLMSWTVEGSEELVVACVWPLAQVV